MNRGIRFSAALLAVWATLSPAALGDGASGPLPAPAPKPGPLKPGKSAGVRAAQQEQVHTGLALVGAGAIIAVIAVTASSNGGNGSAQPNSQSVPATTS